MRTALGFLALASGKAERSPHLTALLFLPDSKNHSHTVRVTAMLEDMADFSVYHKNAKQNNAKTPNKTPQKYQTKHHKNTKHLA
ncbi:hypothetical protein [Leyella stercorea]